ncbi:MAG: family ATPase [Proteobacteria bacterium]|nr:family ATPase [Pseudomonadota bacterium]
MYKDYFRLSEMPFSIAPDPRFLFMSDRHREALAHLLYGIQGEGGIVLLTGEVGTGKTTICRSMLEQLPDNIDVAFILNPLMSAEELLETVCEEYHIPLATERRGIKAFVDAIHARLLAANAHGRRAILIIDEAQNLSPLVLEQLRLLTNLETNTRKLLQIILIGQPELQDLLAQPAMRQVAQRVIARYHLCQLRQYEVKAYVTHRLRVSGAAQGIFPERLIKQLYRASGGVPRLINLICDRALLGAYVQGQQEVSAPTLRQAISEVAAARRPQRRRWAIAATLLALFGLAWASAPVLSKALTAWWQPPTPMLAPVAPPATVPPPAQPPPAATGQLAAAELKAAAMNLDWPSDVPRSDSEKLAFLSLFKLYGIAPDAGSKVPPCRRAEEYGQRCYVGRGGIADLLLLDQPVVIRLAVDGREYSATLTGLDRQTATLYIAGEERQVALNDLANAWSGNFILIWKAPPGFRDQAALSQPGPALNWLRQAMSRIDGTPDAGKGAFDAALARRIRAFQLAEGIQPDGFVGPRTAIRINARSGQGGPRLAGDRKG